MKFVKLLLIASILGSGFAQASFDIRQEYKADRKEFQSRMKSGYKWSGNMDTGLELKFRSRDPKKCCKDYENYEQEFTVGFLYKLTDEWKFSPSMPINNNEDGKKTYKPSLRFAYEPKWAEGFAIISRYRMDIKPHEDIAKKRHRLTFVGVYKAEHWTWTYETNYYYADDSRYNLYNNNRTNYEQNLKINFRRGPWSPYVEFGDIALNSSSDDRELRARIGLRFAFNIYEWDKVNARLD